jgi:hypothetical protein
LNKFYFIIITALTCSIVLGLSLSVSAQENSIPSWIKNNAKWWSDGQIDDEAFISGIKYLIENDIMTIETNGNSDASSDELTKQAEELVYYRMFTLYDYKSQQTYKQWFTIPSLTYFQYRDDPSWHVPALVDDKVTANYYSYSMGTWQDVQIIAGELRTISGNDDELFANLVMQMVHQFKYEPTLYTKTPIEVFVEGSGDCDTLAVFAATVMYAGGLDVAILDAHVPSSPESTELDGGHALVGVAIDADDWTENWYTDLENGKRYYLAEATWPDEGLLMDPWEYTDGGYGTVGANPWGENIDILGGTLPPV